MTDANTEPKRKPTEIAPEDKPPRDMDEERKKFEAIIARQNKVTREYNRGKFLSL
jgi:hypothetical protein